MDLVLVAGYGWGYWVVELARCGDGFSGGAGSVAGFESGSFK
ncbi:hypothetical protein TM233_67400 [Bradyrhizobium sp. TM233]|nr:hypothetical protein TM233_67400 [Bradyrhizobium sp. TM233]